LYFNFKSIKPSDEWMNEMLIPVITSWEC
jgi:hypothetical protein